VGSSADSDIRTTFYAAKTSWSSKAPFTSVGQYIPFLQATYKVVSAAGEGGSVLEQWMRIDLERVDSLPDGGRACFSEPVFCVPILDSRMYQIGEYAPAWGAIVQMELRLFEPPAENRLKFATLNIQGEATLHDRGLPKVDRWVTVSKDSVFNLRDDKEMKVWLKVVDFVPRNDELGITGWIRVMRVDEPATPKTPSPPSQPQPSP
jgi:hypothetical protein